MRRPMNDPFGRLDAQGETDIPYDQTAAPDAEVPAGDPSVVDPTMADPALQTAGTEDPVGQPQNMLAAIGGGQDPAIPAAPDAGAAGGFNTDMASDADLESLQSPEDTQVDQMDGMLTDPNTSPQERAQLEQAMALAARRRMMEGGM